VRWTWWGTERRERPPEMVVDAADLPRGEKVLAHAQDGVRWLLGTRAALVVVVPGEASVRLPWELVQAADWDQDANTLKVSEVGEYGRARASYLFTFEKPALLLQLVRERVTASVVLQHGHLVSGKRGFKVIGRRSPEGVGPIYWMFEFDAGIDPDDPLVAYEAEAALAQARSEVGE
jgi:hypothetical protein